MRTTIEPSICYHCKSGIFVRTRKRHCILDPLAQAFHTITWHSNPEASCQSHPIEFHLQTLNKNMFQNGSTCFKMENNIKHYKTLYIYYIYYILLYNIIHIYIYYIILYYIILYYIILYYIILYYIIYIIYITNQRNRSVHQNQSCGPGRWFVQYPLRVKFESMAAGFTATVATKDVLPFGIRRLLCDSMKMMILYDSIQDFCSTLLFPFSDITIIPIFL